MYICTYMRIYILNILYRKTTLNIEPKQEHGFCKSRDPPLWENLSPGLYYVFGIVAILGYAWGSLTWPSWCFLSPLCFLCAWHLASIAISLSLSLSLPFFLFHSLVGFFACRLCLSLLGLSLTTPVKIADFIMPNKVKTQLWYVGYFSYFAYLSQAC